ncbi:hemerythrin family protein [Duganella sp. sic0402]|uniref:bacteriohemerythrin n=1 Tax=Duganella sp. sic0402 TaxID=2854786 RepID=UPI001C493A6C|nr:hemerythrin family protein [Duganella sp. sic0402]MBV7534903.1 hemerythrin family protein [Duganella sp. sic0402]
MDTNALSADMVLGIPLFDEAHAALAEQINVLLEGPDEEFEENLAALIECLEDDFRVEEQLMEAIDYPATRSHREQHARVLATLHGLAPGDIDAGRKVAALILPWFQVHLATADTALAIALQIAGRAHGAPAGQDDVPAARLSPRRRPIPHLS